jgi:hypothetical protein
MVPTGVELVVGVANDSLFGSLVMVGLEVYTPTCLGIDHFGRRR